MTPPPLPSGATLAPAADTESRLRHEVSDLRGLLALSLLMTARRHEEEIVHVAVTALPALVAVRPLGVHLVDGERTTWLAAAGACAQPSGRSEAAAQIRRLPADDGPLTLRGEPWCWAIPLRSLGDLMGHLVVAAEAEPSKQTAQVWIPLRVPPSRRFSRRRLRPPARISAMRVR